MNKKTVNDFLIYTAESIKEIEKITGKSVEVLEYDVMDSSLQAGGDMKKEYRNKVILKFHEPPKQIEPVPVRIVETEEPVMPLLNKQRR